MIEANRKPLDYRSRRASDEPIRLRVVTHSTEYRRFGLPRLTVLLGREGIADKHKRIADLSFRRITSAQACPSEARAGPRSAGNGGLDSQPALVAGFRA